MADLQLLKLTFRKEDLNCLVEEERVFLFQMGGVIQEIITLRKLMYMSGAVVNNPIERMAENAQALYFLRLLASTLYESWKAFSHRKFKTLIASFSAGFDQFTSNSNLKLQEYFSNKKNECYKIRNEFQYHYNYGQVSQALQKWQKKDPLEIYFSDLHANCRYIGTDDLVARAVLGASDYNRFKKKLDELLHDVGEIGNCFLNVLGEILSKIMIKG